MTKKGGVMTDKKKKQTKFKFKYVIPDHLQDCYVNGAWGGVTPRGEIHMHVYSERHPIPLEITYNVKKNGSLGKSRDIVTGGNAVRLVQSSMVFDLKTAVAIRDWLDSMINVLEKPQKKKKKG